MADDAAIACGERLVGLRVLTADEHARVAAALPDAEKMRTVNGYLTVATQQGLLTKFQADRVARGEEEGLVLGDYKLLYKAAAGSFARVFRAVSLKDGKPVALKLLREGHSTQDGEVARFYREAKLLMKLRHEHIVPIYDLGQVGDSHFFTMEFIGGGNLKDLIRSRGAFPGNEATAITYQMVSGLAAAMRQNVQHRDMKPSNVLMTEGGVVKLVDFGLAVYDDPYGLNEDRTVEYLTLEKYSKAPADDPRSDVFFAGAIFYHLLTGQSPFGPAKNIQERKNPSRYREIRPARSHQPNLDSRISAVLERMLQFRPAQRYESAEMTLTALRDLLRAIGEPIPGRKSPPKPASAAPAEDNRPIVLCVDHREKAQKRLREYFSKRGYRSLIVSDTARALRTLKGTTVAAVVLVGDSIGDEVFEMRPRIASAVKGKIPVTVSVLTAEQGGRRGEIAETTRNLVMVQPITLRDLRKRIHQALNPNDPMGDSRAVLDLPDE